MGLLQSLLSGLSHLGFNGGVPPSSAPSVNSTLHNQSSINNHPPISRNPSQLDEGDPLNNSRFNSSIGHRYLDNPPR